MTDVAVVHGVLQGCQVSAQGTPNMTVAVAAGFVLNANTSAYVSAQNATITTADPTNDRVDLVTVSNTGVVSVLAGTPSTDPIAPASSDVEIGQVHVYSQANPSYTGTIVPGVVQDTRQFVVLSQPANTFAYTFLNSAQTGDPGTGNLGFDTTNVNTLTTLYVNYLSPSWGNVPGSGGYTKLIDWLSGIVGRAGDPSVPSFYLRAWSRKQPNRFVLLKVTSVTDNTTYATLAVSIANIVQNDLGPVSTAIPLSTDGSDTILEFAGSVAPAATPAFWDTEVKCSQDRSSTSTTLVNITDLSIALAASALYEFDCLLVVNSSSNTGVQAGLQYSAAGATISFEARAEGNGTVVTGASHTLNSAATPAFATSGSDAVFRAQGWVKTGANTGNFTAQYLKVTSGTVIARKGSLLRVRAIG